MDPNTFPTKGNLMLAKNSLDLAKMGYDLMDKKRNILIREIMDLIEKAKDIQAQIDTTFREAYAALQTANIENGIDYVQTISYTVPLEESVRIKTRSIMGVEIPLAEADPSGTAPTYAFYTTSRIHGPGKDCLYKSKGADHTAFHGGKRGLPPGGGHQKDPEAGKCPEKHYDSSLRTALQGNLRGAGGEGQGRIHPPEGHQENAAGIGFVKKLIFCSEKETVLRTSERSLFLK